MEPIVDMRKVDKVLIEILTGDDGRVQDSKVVAVVRVKLAGRMTFVLWAVLFSTEKTVAKRPNVSPLLYGRKLGIVAVSQVIGHVLVTTTFTREIFPIFKLIIFRCERIHKLDDFELGFPSARAVSGRTANLFVTRVMVSSQSLSVRLLQGMDDALLVRTALLDFVFVHGKGVGEAADERFGRGIDYTFESVPVAPDVVKTIFELFSDRVDPLQEGDTVFVWFVFYVQNTHPRSKVEKVPPLTIFDSFYGTNVYF